MFGLPLAFTSPWLLLALVSLPAIWWLLRLTPPRPQEEVFPPTRILARLQEKEETPAQSPWWLTLLRLLMAAFVIIAMAGPILNPDESTLSGDGPVMIVMDDGWASATEWDNRRSTALSIVNEARESGRTVILESTTGRESWTGQPISAEDAAGLLQAAESRPLEPDHEETGKRIAGTINNTNPGQVS
ncbi:MAG: BatA domain-containing protein, partial [Pseudomonadota bacterium]